MKGESSVLAIGVDGSSLLHRVRRLFGFEPVQSNSSGFVLCAAVLVTGIFMTAALWQAPLVEAVSNGAVSKAADSNGADEDPVAKTAQLKILNSDGSDISLQGGLDVEFPFVGYQSKNAFHEELRTNEQGVLHLNKLTKGTHSFVVYPANKAHVTLFSV